MKSAKRLLIMLFVIAVLITTIFFTFNCSNFTIINLSKPGTFAYRFPVSEIIINTDYFNQPVLSNQTTVIEEYSIDKPLPSGLILDNLTGEIRGRCMESAPAQTYTITGENQYGRSNTTITLSVINNPNAPLKPDYGTKTYSIAANSDVNIINLAALEQKYCYSNVNWYSDPQLPDGLSIKHESGDIYGYVTNLSEAKTYAITVSNVDGTQSATVTIEIIRPVVTK